jgi:asparagine synthase (glutamine-hydrolysing)
MCGIAGIFERSSARPVEEAQLRQMLALLRHRGPDEFGILLDHGVGLGNARLSIIDLAGGSQPIANEDETLWVVFNGEIFNYPELRKELEARQHRFRTNTDTEVILHLYEEFGPRCVDHLNGQFAIALWDKQARQLFLARDRLGVRPLFYTVLEDGALLFGSEIKALRSDPRVRAELDPSVIEEVFRFWAPLPQHSVFRGIQEVPAGHFLIVDKDSIKQERYWRNEFPAAETLLANARAKDRPIEEIVEEFRALLVDACRVRLRADVPVGAYLSGGLDSSTIASIVRRFTANRLVTFSIAFGDEVFDESQFQSQMASHLGTEHHIVRTSYADIGQAFPDVVWHTETPVLRTAPAPMFLLSKLVRDHGFKVVLTGEGADEFLAGYHIFKEAKIRRFWAQQPHSSRRPLLLKGLYPDIPGIAQSSQAMLAQFFGQDLEQTHLPWYSHALRWRNNRRLSRFFEQPSGRVQQDVDLLDLAGTFPANFNSWEPLAQAQYLEISIFLSQYLLSSQGDRVAMAHSVEGRFPFLDVRLVEFCNALGSRMKLRGLDEKYLLKQAARPWLPKAITGRPKRPYRAPIHRSFFSGEQLDYVEELLSPSALKSCGLFKPQAVQQLALKIKSGAPLGETDDMALAGILSTQLIHFRFVKNFRCPEPLSERDAVKICRLN